MELPVRDYNSTPQRYPPRRFRTILGRISPYIVLISSLSPGGVPLGGTIVIPEPGTPTVASFSGNELYSQALKRTPKP